MKVVVVGAGIVGASVAYHLSRRTDVEVSVVHENFRGQATAAGAGIVCPWLSDRRDLAWYRLAKAGATYYPTLVSELEALGEEKVGYSLVDAMRVSNSSEELAKVERLVMERKMDAPEVGEVSRLTPEEARGLFPPLVEDLGAVHVTGGARVDGQLVRDALFRAAEKQGAAVFTSVGPASLLLDGERVVGVQAGEWKLEADTVVLATGAWGKRDLDVLGIELPVEPQKGQIVHLEMPDAETNTWPVVLPETSHYLLAFDGGRVVVGATRENGSGFDERVTAAGLQEVLGEALRVAPGLEAGTVKDIRVGYRPVTPDLLPVIGAVPSAPNVVVANGLGSLGLTMGPYVGKLAADLAVGEQVEVDLTPYSPVRELAVEK